MCIRDRDRPFRFMLGAGSSPVLATLATPGSVRRRSSRRSKNRARTSAALYAFDGTCTATVSTPLGSKPSGAVAMAHRLRTSRPAPASRLCLLYTSDAADERSSVDLGG